MQDDNAGPPLSIDEVVGNWQEIQGFFPGAEIIASTLDNFTSVLAAHKSVLPVIEYDLSDSWIMGAPSDPVKLQRTRAIMRATNACIATGACTFDDPQFFNFSRQVHAHVCVCVCVCGLCSQYP